MGGASGASGVLLTPAVSDLPQRFGPGPSPDSVVCLWKLVRPGIQIPARMPRASLNPSIPPPNAAGAVTSAVGGAAALTQQVNVPIGEGSDLCFPGSRWYEWLNRWRLSHRRCRSIR